MDGQHLKSRDNSLHLNNKFVYNKQVKSWDFGTEVV